MPKFQIREEPFGLALYSAEDAESALLKFLADRERALHARLITRDDDGSARIDIDGQTFSAVPIARRE